MQSQATLLEKFEPIALCPKPTFALLGKSGHYKGGRANPVEQRVQTMIETRTIKGYELRKELGRGGNGAVYLAHQASIERDVAMKVILPQYANQPDFIRRFEVEAQLVARLEHPFIVPLFDYWRDPDGAFLVMRWIRGGSLLDALHQRKMIPLPETYAYLKQIGAALALAHRNGVVHRDLKPGNILLDEDQNAYLTDFGIAHVQGRQGGEDEQAAVIGSPGYLSPEQITNQPVTGRSDLYSLGIMTYEMLTGHHPYRKEGESLSNLLLSHIQEPLPSVFEFGENADLPSQVEEVLRKATAKDPDDRYQDVPAFVSALHGVLSGGDGSQAVESVAISNLPIENPYKGLRAFNEADAGDFYGREQLVGELIGHFQQPDNRFLAVVGPSGSGKSSVIRAGLIPALRSGTLAGSDNWFYADMVPATNPIQQLASTLESIAVDGIPDLYAHLLSDRDALRQAVDQLLHGTDSELVLLIDQFEEVFTLGQSETIREQFLALIYTAVTTPGSRLRVLVTLRADFYDRPLLYSEFGGLVQRYTRVVLPLSPSEIERAVTMPAKRVGVQVDTDLIAAIIDDVREEPGALPLLQYALTELFEMRQDNRLTLNAYEESGGVVGALARRAEQVYIKVPGRFQPLVRQLFLRLITLGEGREDTRRRVALSELRSITRDRDNLDKILDAFGKFRLLTFDRDPDTREPMVEVAHEALIREWSRLKEWLETMRDDIRLQRVLAASSTEWINANRDHSYLIRGGQLAQYEEWYQKTDIALTEQEQEFIQTSLTQRQRERNREAAQRRRETRQRRWLAVLSAVAAGVAMVAIGTAIWAFTQQAVAQQERQLAQSARATSDAQAIRAENAVATATIALGQAEVRANELQSIALLSNAQTAQETNPALTLALAVAANRIPNAPRQALQTLYQLAYRPGPRALLGQHDGAIFALASHENRVASGGEDDLIRLWDRDTGEALGTLDGHTDDVLSLDWSRRGEMLLSGAADKLLLVWDADTTTLQQTLTGHTGAVQSVALNRDASRAVSGGDDRRVIIWDLAAGEPRHELTGHTGRVRAVAFAPDDSTVLSGGADNTIYMWDAQSGQRLMELTGHNATVTAITYLNRRSAVSGDGSGRVIIWDLESGLARRVVSGHEGAIWDFATLDGGEFLSASGAASNTDSSVEFGEIKRWRGSNGIVIDTYRAHQGRIRAILAPGDGDTMISAGTDGIVLTWDATENSGELQRYAEGTGAVGVATDPTTDRLFTSGGLLSPADMTAVTSDGAVSVWDTATQIELALLNGHDNVVRVLALRPGGDQLLTAGDDSRLLLWDVGTGEIVREFVAHEDGIWGLSVKADGTQAATAGLDGRVIVWDIASGEPITTITGYGPARDVAFHPTASQLAFAADRVVIWDLDADVELVTYDTDDTGAASVAYHPTSGELAFAATGSTAGILSDDGTRITRLDAAADLNRIRYSPDGRLLATSSMQGVQLWDAATGNDLFYFTDRTPAWEVVFSADGAYLWAASQDGNVRQYPVAGASLADWTEANRYLQPLSCEQQAEYRVPLDADCER